MEEYDDAASGFLAHLIQNPQSPQFDSAQYMAAEAALRNGKELEAAEEFGRIATSRPDSPFADDAQLGLCRAYSAVSPKVSLSQEFTRRAIDECGRLLQFFPTTPLRDEAERLVVEARTKLARKSYEIGKYYQDNRKLPEAAIVYYQKSLAENPPSDFLPDLLLRLYEMYDRVGFETEAQNVLDRLVTDFPDSEEAAKVESDATPEPPDFRSR